MERAGRNCTERVKLCARSRRGFLVGGFKNRDGESLIDFFQEFMAFFFF